MPNVVLIETQLDPIVPIVKGTKSLVKNSISGIMTATSKISGTLGAGISNLTFDDNYLRERQQQRYEKPLTGREGFSAGLRHFGHGFAEGAKGIFREPIRGAHEQNAFKGVFKGVAKGVVGLAVKPVVGTLDLVSKTTEGIRNRSNSGIDPNPSARKRYPRYFSLDQILRPYKEDELKAKNQLLLRNLNSGQFSNEFCLLYEQVLNGIFIVSNLTLLLIESPQSTSITWAVLVSQTTRVDQLRDKIQIMAHTPGANLPRIEVVFISREYLASIFEKLSSILKELQHPTFLFHQKNAIMDATLT